MIKSNGGIIGPDNVTTGGAFGTASGVFKLGEVTDLIKDSKWPTAGPGGHQVANSCRFNDGSSDNLSKTPSGDGSRVKWTWSGWVKRCSLGHQPIFSTPGNSSNIYDEFYFNSTDKIQFSAVVSGTQYALRTKRQFRDFSAWYSIVLIFDSNNSTASDRMQLWINGVRTAEADLEDITFKDAQNYNSATNKSGYVTYIGRVTTNSAAYYDGYMSEVAFQNDSATTPVDKFGEFNSVTNIWVPKDISGLTFGTNGSYLDFKDSSALGNDAAGSNNFTANNLTSIDQSIDTCTNNFATLNPLASLPNTGVSTFSEGNLVSQGVNGSYVNGGSTFQMTTGKWYAEVKYLATSGDVGRIIIGITQDVSEISRLNQDNGSLNTTYNNYDGAGGKNVQGTGSTYGSDFGLNDIIGIALDLDNEKLYFSVNGTWQNSGVPTSGSTGTGAITGFSSPSSSISGGYFFFSGSNTNAQNNTVSWNFGSPSFAISSGNADGNGFGNFEYAVPSGYLALCTNNLNV